MEERASRPGQKTPTLTQNDEFLKSNQKRAWNKKKSESIESETSSESE
jgi:hypothetical protein